MKKIILMLGVALLSAGCTTLTPSRYSMLVDNNQALKKYAGSQIRISPMLTTTHYEARCRLYGRIHGPDGMSIAQYVEKAFNDELKFANIHSDNGASLTGSLTEIAFSSGHMGLLANGWWDLALSLSTGNGKSMKVASRYEFESSIDARIACDWTARALTPAVQDLIKKAVTDPRFGALLQ